MYYSKNLEIHVVDHCNLDCVGCSHDSPFMPRQMEEPDRLARALSVLWRSYRTRLVKLLGGEPLLHPNIDEIIRVTKEMTNARIRVVTNGMMLKRLHHRLRGIDEIHISSYPSGVIPTDDDARSIAASLNASITIQRFHHFRWVQTCAREDDALTERIFNACQMFHTWQCHTLRNGWFYACPSTATWARADGMGVNLLDEGADCQMKLGRLLTRQTPLESCEKCLGSAGELNEHRFGWRTSAGPQTRVGLDLNFLETLELNPNAHNGCFEYERMILPSGRIVQLRGRNPEIISPTEL
jgi:hypothetical protein